MPFFKVVSYQDKKTDETIYRFVLNAESQDYWNQYSFTLVVELPDWPTSTPAVTQFTVTINPCKVTSFEAPSALNVTYPLSLYSNQMTVEYSFAQAPCTYGGTYSASMTNGTLANQYVLFPPFVEVDPT